MNKFILEANKQADLLPLTLISLNEWSFITVTGIDSEKYLQTQLTADITKLTPQQHLLTAHCDANGKIWSTLRLFHYKKGFGYILRSSLAKKQLNELRKYAIFSKVTLNQEPNIILLGIVGQNARKILQKHFSQLPNKKNQVIQFEKTTLLHFVTPCERFLIVTDTETSTKLKKHFSQHGENQEWIALDIASGIPNIDLQNSKRFIPQAINLQELPSSISFQKGCYTGQETIAKAKYRGTNKRSMYFLYGKSNKIPKPGDPIEWKLGDNWRKTGAVLAAANLKKGFINVQVVMNSDMTKGSIFRICGEEESRLGIQHLSS